MKQSLTVLAQASCAVPTIVHARAIRTGRAVAGAGYLAAGMNGKRGCRGFACDLAAGF